MQALDYLHLQMRLEGIGLDHLCRLIPLRQNVQEFPYFALVQTAEGQTIHYLAASLDPDIQIEIEQKIDSLSFPDIQPIAEILTNQHIQTSFGHFKTYRFPDTWQAPGAAKALSKDDPRVIAFGFGGMAETVYVVEQAGHILSACVSVREDKFCAESWVFTAPEQRGKGWGEKAVLLWAIETLKAGKVPFYSHHVANLPSARLASRLGLISIYEEVVLERVE